MIGLLNGLMIACGPLQAMYVMAAGTGSAVEGREDALYLRHRHAAGFVEFRIPDHSNFRIADASVAQASGAIVIVLGAVMINRGLILTGRATIFIRMIVYIH